MISLGIDLSSQPEKTVACTIEWRECDALARPPVLACTDVVIEELIRQADVVGIDAPFGWPTEFVEAVGGWTHVDWTPERRDRLRFRETDRDVKRRWRIDPLSVSTDRIALPAMRAMSLLRRFGMTDRSGDGRFFEVYPAGTLVSWGLSRRGYKKTALIDARRVILTAIRGKLPWLHVDDGYLASADALDALIASLTARTAAQGLTERPTPEQRDLARSEGWIHLPRPSTWPTL